MAATATILPTSISNSGGDCEPVRFRANVAPMKLPARLAPILFGFLLSGLMSFVVSGISTFRALGLPEGFLAIWMGNWAFSWAVAFPTVLVVAPMVRRIVARIVMPPPG